MPLEPLGDCRDDNCMCACHERPRSEATDALRDFVGQRLDTLSQEIRDARSAIVQGERDGDVLRREGREQVYAELTKLARSQTCAPPCCDGIYIEALATIRAALERDFMLDLEARATGPEVAELQRALKATREG